MSENIEFLKKITFKLVCGVPSQNDIKAAVKADQEILPQSMKVIGVATGVKTITNNDTGEVYQPLIGEFMAVNQKGEKFAAPLLYLPPIAGNIIEGKLGQGAVEFGLEIGTRLPKEGEKSPVGYIYTVRPIIKQAETVLTRLLLAAGIE